MLASLPRRGCGKRLSLTSFTTLVTARVVDVTQVSRWPNYKEFFQDHARCQRWLNAKRIKAFYTPVFSDNLRHGTQLLLQVRTIWMGVKVLKIFPICLNRILFLRPLVWDDWSQTRWWWVSRTTGGKATWETWRSTSTPYSKGGRIDYAWT